MELSFLQHVIKVPSAIIIVAQFGELEILGVLVASAHGSFGPGAVPWGSNWSVEAPALKHPLAQGPCAACGRNCFLGVCYGYSWLHCVPGASQEQLIFYRAGSGLCLAGSQLLIDSLSR